MKIKKQLFNSQHKVTKKSGLLRPLTFSLCMLTFVGASAQTGKVSVNVQDATVKELFSKIEKQTSYRFSYRDIEVRGIKGISVNAQNEELKSLLTRELSKVGLDYSVIDNKIIIVPAASESQQRKQLLGSIIDVNGEPVIGATIMVKGTTSGTVTDMDGKFTLEAALNNVLEVSFVGYKNQLVKVKSFKPLHITLKEDTETLEEVVVVGYGTQKKMNLTGAVSSIKASDFIENRPAAQLGQSLQGKVAGLQVSRSSGRPGAGFSFNVRGTTSLNGGSPLILVDGVEMDPNVVPPEDIETVSVLKDAASSAIYGARAAFGVVLITTKEGKKDQRVQINYSNNFSWSTPTLMPEKVDPETQIEMGALAWGNNNGNYEVYWGHNKQTWLDLYKKHTDRNIFERVNGQVYPIGNTDMIKEMTESGFMQRHNLSLNGGSKRASYYVSAGITKQDGVLISDRDKYTRKNISLKLNSEITDWLSTQISTGYISSRNDFPWIPQGEWYLYDVSYMRPTFWLTGINPEENVPYGYSPHIVKMGAPNYSTENRYNLQLMATIKPVKGLEITGRYTYRATNGEEKDHMNSYKISNPISGGSEYYKNEVNSLRLDNNRSYRNSIDIWAKYKTTFLENHSVSLMAGFNQEKYEYKNVFAKGEQLLSDDLPSLNLAIGNTYVGDSFSSWATRSGFFRLNYDYKGKYLVEAVGRYDGTSKFRMDDRFVFFPSASIGWRVSEEKFMDWSDSFLDNFKIRASYGQQGNQGIPVYSYVPSMSVGKNKWIVDGKIPTVIGAGGLVSNSFTWETVKTTNIGVDLGMFKNRLTSTFEYYIRKTEGMLTPGEVLPSVLGTSVPKRNAADLRVNGWEWSLNWKDRIGDDFSYNVGFVLYDSKTEITKFSNPKGLYNSNYVGKQLGEIWGYETDRLFTEADFITNEKGKRDYAAGIARQDKVFQNRIPYPGDVKYKDLNGDGKIDYGSNTLSDPGDKRIIGNSTPRYQFGINMGASYKGFDLSLFFQGVAKRDLWIGNSLVFAYSGGYESMFKSTADFWREDNKDAYYPRPIADRAWNRQVQSKYLQNGAYMRLKNLTFGYSLPKSILSKIHLTKARLYFSGENLFTLTGLPEGVDPEVGASRTYPFSKELSFGIDVSF